METKTTPMYHLTVKWPGMPGHPEVMVNAYVPSAGELASAFEDIASIAAESYSLPRPRNPFEVAKEEAAAGTQPTPIRQASRPAPKAPEPSAYDDPPFDDEEAEGTHCPKHHIPMISSNYGGMMCPSKDEEEATSWCRWVDDKQGVRRKPTKAESDARRQKMAR